MVPPTPRPSTTRQIAPATRSNTENSWPIGNIEFLDETMSANQIIQTLEAMTYSRELRAVCLDRHVRKNLCDCVRQRIQRATS